MLAAGLILAASTFVMNGCGGGGGSTAPPLQTVALSLSVNPASATIAANDAFFVTVTAQESGTTATPAITLGTLPAGLSTTATFPMSVPSGGATIFFTTSSAIATGNASVAISGSVGSATAGTSIPLNVVSIAPQQPYFTTNQLFREVELPQGASTSVQEQLTFNGGSPLVDVALSVTGLPPGVTASISPDVAEGSSTAFTVTLTASATAPLKQNAEWNVVATPMANLAAASLSYLLDVTAATGGAGWNNQTGYVSTRATPFSAVYDPAHSLIYAANQVWGRIDLINDQTRAIVKSISIEDPRGIDISVDGSTVWVATGSQVMYGINTATQQATQYILPRLFVTSTSAGSSWEGDQVFSLADGTVLLIIGSYLGSESGAIWNPATGSLTQPASPATWGVVARSGDGTRLFSFGSEDGETSFTYDVATQLFSDAKPLLGFGFAGIAAANRDGTRAAVASSEGGFALFDENLNEISPLPGDGGLAGAGQFPAENLLSGGFVFSPDGQTIYEETQATAIPLIVIIDVASQNVRSLAPAMPVIPTLTAFTGSSPGFLLPAPFAVDAAGMVLGIEYHGIAFDDATVSLNYSPLDPRSPRDLQHMSVYSGPMSGGTTSSGFGNEFSLTPDVYYGAAKGTATLSQNTLSITSPPVSSPGPVDVKIIFPDGSEVYDPQFFTFGTKVQDALVSGGSPQGGAAGKLDAFGLPLDPSQDVVTIGGTNAAVTSTVTHYPPFTDEQTDMYLSYTLPPGVPGWADITVNSANGTSKLPNSFFFANSVTDYSTSDSPTFVLYDKTRNQLYLSAGNHIDVFSLATLSFTTALQPPAVGKSKQFEGLALTPDGKYLLATNLSDFSLAVVDPDNPSSAYAVPVATGGMGASDSCATGPLFVAADNLGNAYVVTGGVSGYECGTGGYEAMVNLAAKTSTLMKGNGCDIWGGAGYVGSTGDGTLVAFAAGESSGSFQMYVPSQGACFPAAAPGQPEELSVAADGNVIGLLRAFVNSSGDIVGRSAYPTVFCPNAGSAVFYNYDPRQDGALENPRLNDAGSLDYWAYPNYVNIVDVHHGTPALRFGLTETVTNTVAPLAIDSSGQRMFLITNKGLTIVDLGNAPLSVGHFSQSSAGPGTQLAVRGSGFEEGISATLGGLAASLALTDSETLTLTVPAAGAGPQDLVLTNPDGTTYTLQNAISVQ